MHELWSSGSYEPHLLSLPFALAPAAMLIVIAYTAVMRGAAALRGWLLVHTLALLPYSIVVMLSPSIKSPVVAEHLFRIAVGSIALAAAAESAFQLALVRARGVWRWVPWVLVASSLFWIPLSSTTGVVLDGVRRVSGLFWYPRAGSYAWLGFVHTAVVALPGVWLLGKKALRDRPSTERRQLRAVLLASLITYTGLVDVGLAYGVGAFPIGWLLSGVGCLLLVRALVVEDVLRVRAIDTTAPLLVIYFAGGALLAWVVLSQLGDLPWWVAALTLVICFASVRLAVSTVGLVNRGARGAEGTLDRLLAQLVGRARGLHQAMGIAQLAIDVIELGLGVRPVILLASADDWGWTNEHGDRVPDERAPDPLLAGWLAEQRGARFADDLEPVPADLRDLLAALFDAHAARAIVPVRSADELLGLVIVGARGRRLRGRSLAFLEHAAERLAEALVHSRLAARAAERAALAREVELAATVQAELLPGAGLHAFGEGALRVSVIGSWRPATRCAGDFWGIYELGGGRVLVAIGDVTGHGVASAMVTAAVAGACDVCVRRAGTTEPDRVLGELVAALDAAVRRVGGGALAMTCFAAILDPAASELRFISAGHPAPYLCRAAGGGVELHALVARGNPLGVGLPPAPRVHQRALQAGDLVVWYTDGVIEAQDPAGQPFGDRRLQHLLKKLDAARLAPVAVHELIGAGVGAHRAGRPLGDDATLVVAQIGARA